ncbi:DNA recombination protein RmuC [Kineosporia babensis]
MGFLLGLIMGLALAAAAAYAAFPPLLRARQAALETERDLLRERITDLEAAAGQDHELVATLSPLATTLQRVEKQVQTLERDRVEQFSRLDEHLSAVHASGESLRAQTAALASALRSPTSRGAWGEVQLRRVVEHAGMLPRVDFFTQASGTTPDGNNVRPDLVVHLPGGKYVVVDAKAPLAAFLEASEKGEAALSAAAGAHAKALRAHVDTLAAKEYWTAFQPTPQLVICFVPGEAFLAAACTADPSLLEHAMARRVVLATPTTLLALLRTVALTWQSEAVSGNARHLLEIGTELYRRLSGLGEHAGKLGRDLHRVVEDYNALVGTLERRVLVTARKMQDLDLVDTDLPSLTPLESSPRPLTADELIAGPPHPAPAHLSLDLENHQPSREPGTDHTEHEPVGRAPEGLNNPGRSERSDPGHWSGR